MSGRTRVDPVPGHWELPWAAFPIYSVPGRPPGQIADGVLNRRMPGMVPPSRTNAVFGTDGDLAD